MNLEKLYIFRLRSLETDANLRKVINGKETIKDRCDESITFLKQNDTEFNEHDYGEKNVGLGPSKKPNLNEISEEEYASIEKSVQQALHQNNYFGQFVLKIEEIEPTGLRKVRVIKDNGANVIMKIRMPESFKTPKKSVEIPKTDDSLKQILQKCEIIESSQQKMSRSVLRTEQTVALISTLVQTHRNSPNSIEFVDLIGNEVEDPKDDNAPFELPVESLSELWRLNARIVDVEVREAMNLEMMKLEPQPGIKIIGRVVRAVIDKDLLGKMCWSGRVKVEHKYMKIDDRLMLSKMKNIVDYLLEVCQSKEETSSQVFLQTLMNLIRKARFKLKE